MDIAITGGTRGIGRAIARRLAGPGDRVIITWHRHEELASLAVDELTAAGASAHAARLDIRQPADIQSFADTIAREWGGLDVLVLSAAMAAMRPVTGLKPAHWDLTLETSLRSTGLLASACRPLLRPGGSIVALSSAGAARAVPGYGAMAAAKAGTEALVRQLASEFAPDIRVNAVRGDLVLTDATRSLPNSQMQVDRVLARTPLARLGTPEDLANAVQFLVSDQATFITGQVLVVDGGASVT